MSSSGKLRSRYELRGVLSRGGRGVVYKAYDALMKREVALKTVLDVRSRAASEMFQKEWGLQASVIHPNVVEIYDIGDIEEEGVLKPYFVMPLLPGLPLGQLINRFNHRLTVDKAVDIIYQTCRGLQAAHERGLVHRDLEPGNIFVMDDDSVKIIDFGIVHSQDAASQEGKKGTLCYMAPELLQMQPPSVLTDIFALGAVCYETLTLRRAFPGATDAEISHAILHDYPPPANDINKGVSQVMGRVVHKAIAKQPWHRYGSAREFGDTLLKALRNEPIEFFEPAHVTTRVERATKAFERGDYQLAEEILSELESEGHIDQEITHLRRQIEQARRQINIRQMLESARRFYEEEEYSLSLRKIQEALHLDPDDSSALALKNQLESQRRDKKIDEWLQLAQRHLAGNAFSLARKAIQSLIELKGNDASALEMLAEVDRREQLYERMRQEKSAVYGQAEEAWKRGEVTTALSRLERWVELDREAPETDRARALSCRNFYHQVRSEHEAIQNAHEEARRHLAGQNFPAALALCDQYLAKYPGHALFQALKLDVEERQRQNLLAFIAETDRQVESEPDLGKRCDILQAALQQHPDEPHFARAFRLARDKRDLVNSVVAKARLHEEQGRFGEALDQWEMLQAIHSQHPGLDYEIGRLKPLCDAQSRTDAKSEWVKEVGRYLESGGYTRALESAGKALVEFPDDVELTGLGELAHRKVEAAAEAMRLLNAGTDACAAGRFEEGLDAMRRARRMDEGNTVVRTVLAETLAGRARALLDADLAAAGVLIGEILDLDPNHPLGQSLRAMLVDKKREEFVSSCTAQARGLQAAGDLEGARALVQQGLVSYPQDFRLNQLLSTLNREPEEQGSRQARQRDLEPLKRPEQDSRAAIDPSPAQALDAQTKNLAAQHKDDPEFQSLAGAIEQRIGSPAPPPLPPPPAPAAPVEDEGQVTSGPPRATRAVKPARPVPPAPPPPRQLAAGLLERLRLYQNLPRNIGLAGAVVVVLAAGVYRAQHKPAPPAVPVRVQVRTTPPGAMIKIDGTERGPSDLKVDLPAGAHKLLAELDGYAPAASSVNAQPGAPVSVNLALQPLLGQWKVYSDVEGTEVFLDDKPLAAVREGEFLAGSVAAGGHSFRLASKKGEASVGVGFVPGRVPVLTSPGQVKDLTFALVHQFGSQAWLYCSCEPAKVSLDGRSPEDLGVAGLDWSNLSPGPHEFKLEDKNGERKLSFQTGVAPSVTAFAFVKPEPNTGTLSVLTGEDNASIFLNGKPYRRLTEKGQIRIPNLAAGQYTVGVSKDGYEPAPEQTVAITKGQEARLEFHLKQAVRMAWLRLHDAPVGSSVLVDGNVLGVVGPDGTLASWVAPGDHSIELRKDTAKSKPVTKNFAAGQSVPIPGADLALERPPGTLRFKVSPPGTNVTIRLQSEPEDKAREVSQESMSLPEGAYIVSAAAPDYASQRVAVPLAAGGAATVEIALKKLEPPKPAAPKALGMADWENADSWTRDGDWFVHRGGNFVAYRASPVNGTFVFTIALRKGKHLQWTANRTGDRNYLLFRMDKKNFSRERVVDGKSTEAMKTAHGGEKNTMYTLKIDISPDGITHSIQRGGGWVVLDSWNPAGPGGKFGFVIPGRDEFAIRGFSFTPRGSQ